MSALITGTVPPGRRAGLAAASGIAAVSAAVAAAATAYWLLVRPWHLRWGATAGEVQSAWPGDHLIPHPMACATHAVTIQSPAAEVWPWLAQMGQGRGGFYSYTWLENLIGCRIENADRILHEHQHLQVGDPISVHPDAPPLSVAIVDPGRSLVLAATLAEQGLEVVSGTWAFTLRDLGEDACRLVARTRWTWPPGLSAWVGHRLALEPAHFVMERRMLLGIKQRAEAGSRR
jgi:hypothetical protein